MLKKSLSMGPKPFLGSQVHIAALRGRSIYQLKDMILANSPSVVVQKSPGTASPVKASFDENHFQISESISES